MGYGPKTLKELAWEVDQIATSKGWEIPRSMDETVQILSKLMLVTTEVAEAAEAVRVGDVENFGEELADIVIRVLHLAHGIGVDLDVEIEQKLLKNRSREHRHGGKRA